VPPAPAHRRNRRLAFDQSSLGAYDRPDVHAGQQKYAIYWRLTPSGEIARTVYGTIGKEATQNGVPNNRYVKQFRSELEFWGGQTP
jgi:hypothetical protein